MVRASDAACRYGGDEFAVVLTTADQPSARIFADSGAALYLQGRAGAFFDAGYVPGRGASHGSPYLFDRAVPLFVRAPGAVEAGRRVDEPVPFTRFREMAERLLGL